MPILHFLNYPRLVIALAVITVLDMAVASQQLEQNLVNFKEIKMFADFSQATYFALPEIRKRNVLKNYSLTHYGTLPEFNIFYILATNDAEKKQIMAVRGTSNIENAIVDIAIKLTPDKHTGIRLHNGFSQAAQQIYQQVLPLIRPDYVVSTTGHSLGGAVALVMAMRLDVDNYKTGHVVTFGQPKVTNIAGARKFQHISLTRVVTPKDIIPLVPPFDPLDLNDIDIYWHLGREVVLFPDTTYALLGGMKSMLRATRFTQEPLDENNLKNHQMTVYQELLDKKIPEASLVPYEYDFNLFNLFGSARK